MSAPISEVEAQSLVSEREAVAAGVLDWPLAPSRGGLVRIGLLAWVRARQLDLVMLAAAVVPCSIVHAWGMHTFPAFFDDEGTYVSQAYAVDKLHALAPYTYWYDHPPLGWIALGGWGSVASLFNASSSTIGGSRTFVFLLFVVSAALLYGIARRLALPPALSALAVGLFGLSPLAVDYQRMVLLDNIAMPWLLGAFFLALTPTRRIAAYAGSAVLFAAAVLTKETFVLLLPALVVLIWTSCPRSTRRFAIAVFGSLVTSIGAFYPLFALLRGELLSGKHHTSLLDGIRFQLSRVGGGSVFDSHSPTRHLLADLAAPRHGDARLRRGGDRSAARRPSPALDRPRARGPDRHGAPPGELRAGHVRDRVAPVRCAGARGTRLRSHRRESPRASSGSSAQGARHGGGRRGRNPVGNRGRYVGLLRRVDDAHQRHER